jgi:hypothetical protein
MNKKNLIYIVGGLAVLGIGYYIYKKRSKAIETPNQDGSGDNRSGDVSGSGGGATTPPRPSIPLFPATTPVTPPVTPPVVPPATSPTPTTTKLTNLEVEKRIFTACGIKPTGLFAGRRNQWDECKDRTKANLKAQGLISFDGGFMDDFADDNYGL